MLFFAALVIGIIIIGYLAFVWAVAYHVYTYTLPGDISRILLWVFVSFSLCLLLGVAYYLSQVPWDYIALYYANLAS